MASSVLTDKFGFSMSQEIYAGVLAVFFVSYFLFCGNFKMFGRSYEAEIAQSQIEEKRSLIGSDQPQASFFDCFKSTKIEEERPF